MGRRHVGYSTSAVPWGEDWIWDAACSGMDTEIFFDGQDFRRAIKICRRCPVMLQCRAWNDQCEKKTPGRRIEGVFGGETPKQRSHRRNFKYREGVKT